METPGPIPNPEAKHSWADDTWRAASRESRSWVRIFYFQINTQFHQNAKLPSFPYPYEFLLSLILEYFLLTIILPSVYLQSSKNNRPQMKVKRDITKLIRNPEEDTDFVALSPEERVSFIWEITMEIWSLMGEFDAEQRLQRNITNIIRK